MSGIVAEDAFGNHGKLVELNCVYFATWAGAFQSPLTVGEPGYGKN